MSIVLLFSYFSSKEIALGLSLLTTIDGCSEYRFAKPEVEGEGSLIDEGRKPFLN